MEHEFYSTFKGSRPVRLSESTRDFAWDSLNAKYGRLAKTTPSLEAEQINGFAEMTSYEKYDAMIRLIAEKAPVRIFDGELFCGSASLGSAMNHVIPVTYGGQTVMGSVSHVTLGFDRALREGLNSYRERIHKRALEPVTDAEAEYLRSLENTLDSIAIWHERYLKELGALRDSASDEVKKGYYAALYDNLKRVPFEAPESFREAIQSLWFMFAFTRLCGNWSAIGRFDYMLGGLLDADLSAGKLTLDEARELIAHFWIKGCEWITLDEEHRGTGDAQHYQNIVLAGCDADGNDITNTLTYLVLDIVEEFPIPDFPIAVRVNPDTDDKLLEKIAAVQRHGGGVVAVYNEKLIIDSLVEFGYPRREANLFANDGCWEVQIPGKTCFSYCPIDIYGIYENEVLGMSAEETPHYDSFEQLFDRFRQVMAKVMYDWNKSADGFAKNGGPCTVIGLFEDDCIENARDYYRGGCRYNSFSPHLGGVPDTANSMYAIKNLVFDEKRMSFEDFISIVKANWEGNEELRRYVSDNYTYYGNDSDGADGIVTDIMDCFMNETRKVKYREHVFRPPGISTFGRQIDWKDVRKPHAFGAKQGDILASNLSPSPGTDKLGATAVIRSHCKIDLSRLTCGTALDIKLEPNSVKGEEGIVAISGLIKGFVLLGGFFLQIDVLDNEILLEAQRHPMEYQNLAVRISGWSARFVTLSDDWQRMIIERSTQRKV